MPNIIEITDFAAPELDVYARLREVQLLNRQDPEQGIFIAESPRVIERALDAGCVPLSFLVEKKHLEQEARTLMERCPESPFLYSGIRCAYTDYRIQTDQRYALRHAAAKAVKCRGSLCWNTPDCYIGKCGKPHQCGSYFPLCCS